MGIILEINNKQYIFLITLYALAASGKTTDQGQGPRDQGNQGQQDRRNNQGCFKNKFSFL